jgi:hypothetical protein
MVYSEASRRSSSGVPPGAEGKGRPGASVPGHFSADILILLMLLLAGLDKTVEILSVEQNPPQRGDVDRM